MVEKLPTKKYMTDYIRAALKKGCLTDAEHSQIAEWLPLHPDYRPHWVLCRHGKRNQQGGYGMCVYGDGKHWLTSYLALNIDHKAYERRCLETACRNALRPSRDKFLASHPGCVADHANPGGFKAILDAFIAENGMPSVEYSKERNEWSLSPDHAAMFRRFHDARVQWQALSPEEHRKVTKERQQGTG